MEFCKEIIEDRAYKIAFDLIFPYLYNGIKILEVGSGVGWFLKELVINYGVYGVGIDPFPPFLYSDEKFKVYKLRAESISELNEKFDILLSVRSFHHIENTAKFIHSITDVIPDGVGIIVDWKKGVETELEELYYSIDEVVYMLEAEKLFVIEKGEEEFFFYIKFKPKNTNYLEIRV